jgi:hypothetical protein
MSQADANRVQLSFIEESVWGTTPGTAFQELRMTGESLAHTINNITSAELRDDRQVTDLIQVDENPAGGINFELSYGTFDSFLEGALWSSWSTNLTKSDTSIEAGASTGFTTVKASLFNNVVVGTWIEVGGFTTTGNNTYYLVTAKNAASTQITTTPKPVDEAAGDTVTMGGAYLRNGVTEKSYVLERKHADITQYYLFSGMVVDQFQLSLAASSIITGSFSFIGKNTTLAQTPAVGAADVASTTGVMNAATNVGTVMEGATLATLSSGLFIQSIDFTIANNVRSLKAIANAGTADIGVGQVDVTGTMNVYFKDETLADKFFGATATGISFKCEDSAGNAYIFTFPKIKFESDGVNVGGANQDVMENLGWRAVRHSATQDYTVQVMRFAA